MSNPTDPIERAIGAMHGQQKLADGLGIKSPSITDWKKTGRIPAERVVAIESLTGIPRHELRPDLYQAGA